MPARKQKVKKIGVIRLWILLLQRNGGRGPLATLSHDRHTTGHGAKTTAAHHFSASSRLTNTNITLTSMKSTFSVITRHFFNRRKYLRQARRWSKGVAAATKKKRKCHIRHCIQCYCWNSGSCKGQSEKGISISSQCCCQHKSWRPWRRSWNLAKE